ncbi:hypothetical protein D3C71_1390390 [compost metagenome]
MTRSKRVRASSASACSPFSASTCGRPSCCMRQPINAWLVGWSSTISTRRCSNAGGSGSVCACSSAAPGCSSTGTVGRVSSTSTQVPSPGTLCSVSVPCIIATSRWQMLRPRPVPPYWRLVAASACANGANSRSRCSGEMPIPVSRTVRRSRCAPSVSVSSTVNAMSTSPAWVNLMALLSRLNAIWRRRMPSARCMAATSSSIWICRSRPLATACGASSCCTLPSSARSATGCGCSDSAPASILE